MEEALKKQMSDINENKGDSTEIQTYGRADGKSPWTIRSSVKPILKVKWGQWKPYNRYCPYDGSKQCPTGCVITATAQILSHFQTIGSVRWSHNGVSGSSVLDWSQIISDCEQTEDKEYGILVNNRYTSSYQVAHLMRYLGVALGADYGKNGTSANNDKPIDWMNKWGGLKATVHMDYRSENTTIAVGRGQLIYMSAYARYYHVGFFFRKYVDGHAWVIDGFRKLSNGRITQNYVHCNFGWDGSCDGYYLDAVFDTTKGPEDKEDIDEIGEDTHSHNFRYKIKMAFVNR